MRIGLIGASDHWHTYASALKGLPGTEVAAVAPSTPEEALARFDSAPGVTEKTRRFSDASEMLKTERLDVVQVACRSDRIAGWVGRCFERNIPVISEKPLAMNLESLQTLYEQSRKSGTPLLPMHTIRDDGAMGAVHHAIRSGQIGEPLLASSQKSYRWGNSRPDSMRSRDTFPGVAAYIGVHAFDWLYWILGDVFTDVHGFQGSTARPDYPACASQSAFVFSMKNGGGATVTIDYLRPAPAPTHGDDRVRVVGTRGVVEGYVAEKRATMISEDKAFHQLAPVTQDMVTVFLRSLSKKVPPPMSTYDAFRITEIALSAQLAADTGRTISLRDSRFKQTS
jgi:predicted dehydrogenase